MNAEHFGQFIKIILLCTINFMYVKYTPKGLNLSIDFSKKAPRCKKTTDFINYSHKFSKAPKPSESTLILLFQPCVISHKLFCANTVKYNLIKNVIPHRSCGKHLSAAKGSVNYSVPRKKHLRAFSLSPLLL